MCEGFKELDAFLVEFFIRCSFFVDYDDSNLQTLFNYKII